MRAGWGEHTGQETVGMEASRQEETAHFWRALRAGPVRSGRQGREA